MSDSDNEALETNSVDGNNEVDPSKVKETAQRFLDEYEDALKSQNEKSAFDAAFTAAAIDMHHDEMDKLVDGDPIAHGVDLMERSESEEFRNSVLENARDAAGEDLSKRLTHEVEEQTVENSPTAAEIEEPIIATRESGEVDISDLPSISATRDEDVDISDVPPMSMRVGGEEESVAQGNNDIPAQENTDGVESAVDSASEVTAENKIAEVATETESQEVAPKEEIEETVNIDTPEVSSDTKVSNEEVVAEQEPLAASSAETDVTEVAAGNIENNAPQEQTELAASSADQEVDSAKSEISQDQVKNIIDKVEAADDVGSKEAPKVDVMGANLKDMNLKDINDNKFVSDVNPQAELDELDKLLAATQNDVNSVSNADSSPEIKEPDANSQEQDGTETSKAAEKAEQQLIEEEEKAEKVKKAEKQEAEYSRASFMQKDDLAQNTDIESKTENVAADFKLKEDEKLVVISNEQNDAEGFSINKTASAIADFENTIKEDGTLVRTDKENPDNSIEIKFSQDGGFEIDISNFKTDELEGGKYITSIATDSGQVNFTIEGDDITINNIEGQMEGQLTIKNGDQELTLDKDGKMTEVAEISASAEYSQPQQEQKAEKEKVASKEQATGEEQSASPENKSSQAQTTDAVAASATKSDDKTNDKEETGESKADDTSDKSKAFGGAEKAVVGVKNIIDAPGAMLDGVKNTAPVVAESVATAARSVVSTAAAATDSMSEKGLNAMAKIPDAMSSVNNKISGLLSDVSDGLKSGMDESLKKSSSLEKSWFSKAVDKMANAVESAAENRAQAAESYKATADGLRDDAAESADQAKSMRESRDQLKEQTAMERSILAAQLTGRADTAEKRKEQLAEMTKDENAPQATESQKEVAANLSERVKEEGDLSKEQIEAIRKENKDTIKEVSEKDDGGHALKEQNDSRLDAAKELSESFEKENSAITPELLENASQEFNSRMEEKLANDMTDLDAAREIFEEVSNARESQAAVDADQQKQMDELAYVASIALEATEISTDEAFKAQAGSVDREEVERVNAKLLEKLEEYEDLPVHEAATKTYEDLEKVKDEIEANPNSTEEEKVNAANDWFAASDLLDKVEEDQGITEDFGTMKEFAMSKGGQVAALALLASGGLMSGVGVEAVINGDPLLMNSGVAGTSDDISASSTPVADMVTEGWLDIIDSASSAVSEFIDSAPELVDSIGDQVMEKIDSSPDQDIANPDVNSEPEVQTPSEQESPVIGTDIDQPDSRIDAAANDITPEVPDTDSKTTIVEDGHTITTEVDGNSVKTVDVSENEAGNTVTETKSIEEFKQVGDLGQKINGEANDIAARGAEVRNDLQEAINNGSITQDQANEIVSNAIEADDAKSPDDKTTLPDRIEAGLNDALGNDVEDNVEAPAVENQLSNTGGAGGGDGNSDNLDDITESKTPLDLAAATVGDDTNPDVVEVSDIDNNAGDKGEKEVSAGNDKSAETPDSQTSDVENKPEVKPDKYDELVAEIHAADNIDEAKQAIKDADLTAEEQKRIERGLVNANSQYNPEGVIKNIETMQDNANAIEEIREMAEEAGLSEAQEEKLVNQSRTANSDYSTEKAENALEKMQEQSAQKDQASENQEPETSKEGDNKSGSEIDGNTKDGKDSNSEQPEVKNDDKASGNLDLDGATVTTEVEGNSVKTVDVSENEAGNTVTETKNTEVYEQVGDLGQTINGQADAIEERGAEVRNDLQEAINNGSISQDQANEIVSNAVEADDAKSPDDKTTLVDRIEAGLNEAIGNDVEAPAVNSGSVNVDKPEAKNDVEAEQASNFLNDAPDIIEESANSMVTGISENISAVGEFISDLLIPSAQAADASHSIAIDTNDAQQADAYRDFGDNYEQAIKEGMSDKDAFSSAINETAMDHPEIAAMIQEDMGQLLANPEVASNPELQEIFNDAFVEKADVISTMYPEGATTPEAAPVETTHDTSHLDNNDAKLEIDSTDDRQADAYKAFLDNLDKLTENGMNEMEAYLPAVEATQETHPDINMAIAEDVANFHKDGTTPSFESFVDNAQEIIDKARIVVAESEAGTLDAHIEGKPAMDVDSDDAKNVDTYKAFIDNFEKSGGYEAGADLAKVFVEALEETRESNPEIDEVMKADSKEYFEDVENAVATDVALSGVAFVEKASEVVERFSEQHQDINVEPAIDNSQQEGNGSLLGDDNADTKLSSTERSDFKSEDGYTERDMDIAEKTAEKYGIDVVAVLETANLLEDAESPEKAIRTMAIHPDIFSGENHADIAATMQSPEFTDMLVEIAEDVLELDKSDIENAKDDYKAAMDEVSTQLIEGNGDLTPYEISTGDNIGPRESSGMVNPENGEIEAPTQEEALENLIKERINPDQTSIDETKGEIQEVVSGEREQLSNDAIDVISEAPEVVAEVYNDNVVRIESAKNHEQAVKAEVAEHTEEVVERSELDNDLEQISASLNGIKGGEDVHDYDVDTSKIAISDDKSNSSAREGRV